VRAAAGPRPGRRCAADRADAADALAERLRHDPRTSATGAVMRLATLRRYARQAGFARAGVLPLDDDTWRFCRLTP
jgi:hypothetical protein